MSKYFVMKRRVQFAETDMAGILHFANYYRWMEEVEHAFWRSTGMSVLLVDGDREVSWPRVATQCENSAPARFEEEIELALRVDRVSKRSVTYEIEFRRACERIALGRTTTVCCIMTKGEFTPIAIPDGLRAVLEEMLSSGEEKIQDTMSAEIIDS